MTIMGVTGMSVIDVAAREATLVAAVGFLIGGADDLAVDAVYFARYFWRRLRGVRNPGIADLAPPAGRYAVFVPAWDEAAVIAPMLRAALARFGYPDYRLYVGLYPNDPATIAEVLSVAADDDRVRPVIGAVDGPTTKAGNLNAVWRALLRDEAADGAPVAAVVLHDAEDVVHRDEFAVYGHYLADHDAVQLPVVPLPDPRSRFISGVYLDEFAEAHGKQLVVRQAIGAGLPFAGVGCAIGRAMIGRVADARGGAPFDPGSLTEDYELGLTIAAMGGRSALAWVTEADGRTPVAVRAFFPAKLDAAVRQKARWMVGIALAGWDRVGWGRPTALAEHWMRMRDRRAPIAMLVLVAAYAALLLWAIDAALHLAASQPLLPPAPWAWIVLTINAALLLWRAIVRAAFVWRGHGRHEALLAVPRMAVGNIVALIAARRALFRYLAMLRGAATRWDKTAHHFPAELARPSS